MAKTLSSTSSFSSSGSLLMAARLSPSNDHIHVSEESRTHDDREGRIPLPKIGRNSHSLASSRYGLGGTSCVGSANLAKFTLLFLLLRVLGYLCVRIF